MSTSLINMLWNPEKSITEQKLQACCSKCGTFDLKEEDLQLDSGLSSLSASEPLDSGFNSLSVSELASPEVERSFEDTLAMYKLSGSQALCDSELVELSLRGVIPLHALEKVVIDYERAVRIRRDVVFRTADTRSQGSDGMFQLPYESYDYSSVLGSCAENVIGYLPVPVGVAGPLKVDGRLVYLPMATTEGTLIASTSRGCKALNTGGGVYTVVIGDNMTRAPIVAFDNILLAAEAKRYIESQEGQESLTAAFSSTTRFGILQEVSARMAGASLYIRFRAWTGEAMGMNMIGKGVEAALKCLRERFSHMRIVSLSGNYCTDKKPAAINWIEGRGKSVVAEAFISADVVQKVLKCTVSGLVRLNTDKNLIGSALAGMSAGGFNAHAANIVTAMFIATGQDPAQNVVSSNCITIMKELDNGSLHATVTMPSIEVGTVGGGTGLPGQAAMLDLLGLGRDHVETGGKSTTLARIIAGGVLAGELSLCAALVTGELIKSHMVHNRSFAK